VLSVLLLAQAHNAHDLLRYCLNFISLYEDSILMSREWNLFKKYTDSKLFDDILIELVHFRDEYHVQHSIELFQKENSKVAKTRIDPEASQMPENLRAGRRQICQTDGNSSSSSGDCLSKQSEEAVGPLFGQIKQCSASELDMEKLFSSKMYLFGKTAAVDHLSDDNKENVVLAQNSAGLTPRQREVQSAKKPANGKKQTGHGKSQKKGKDQIFSAQSSRKQESSNPGFEPKNLRNI